MFSRYFRKLSKHIRKGPRAKNAHPGLFSSVNALLGMIRYWAFTLIERVSRKGRGN